MAANQSRRRGWVHVTGREPAELIARARRGRPVSDHPPTRLEVDRAVFVATTRSIARQIVAVNRPTDGFGL